jgi:hypothetical protein
MPLRPCLGTPGHPCGRLTPNPRCGDCTSAREQARGSRHDRGYDSRHVARRDALLARLRPGEQCDRCGQPMLVTQELDAAHPHDRPLRTHPDSVADHLEHSACNRGARD